MLVRTSGVNATEWAAYANEGGTAEFSVPIMGAEFFYFVNLC